MLKNFKKIVVAALAAVTIMALPVANVWAEDAGDASSSSWLQVAPVSNRIKLIPGSELDYSIVVTNVGEKNFNFTTFAAPYTIIDEGYNLSFTDETLRTQLSHWIQFINPDGSLTDKYTGSVAAGQDAVVNYRVSVPSDVPSGGQYAVILTQTEASSDDIDAAGVITVSRIGMVVYGRTDGETTEQSELVSYEIPNFMTGGKITASSVVKNTGNVDFETKYHFTVTSIVGKELYTSNPVSSLILPDTQRREEFVWEDTPAIGIFQVRYAIETYGETIKDETTYVLIIPIYLIVVTILLLTIIIIWIIMLIRKRKERKSRLLV